MKRLLIAILCCLCLFACATVRPHLTEPTFQAENQPIRTITMLVLYDSSYDLADIQAMITEASECLSKQVGIEIDPIYAASPGRYRADMKKSLGELDRAYHNTAYDMIAEFARQGPIDFLQRMTVGNWKAFIDDVWRRYIVMTDTDDATFLHEIAHAFIWTHEHSTGGLMMGLRFEIVPTVPIYSPIWLAPKDREEVLKHKWRDFQVKADVPVEDVHDVPN